MVIVLLVLNKRAPKSLQNSILFILHESQYRERGKHGGREDRLKACFSEKFCIMLSKLCFKLPIPRPFIGQSTDMYCEEERRTAKNLEKVNFENKYVLDLGCGCGGQTVYFAQRKSTFVIGLDIDKTGLSAGILCAKNNKVNEKVDFVVGDALHLPFRESAFEMIVANHVVEHVPQVLETLKQCKWILKQNGFLYTAFPSWFYPYAGHLCHVIAVPWCHFLFSKKTLINVVSLSMAPSISHTIWQFNNLSRITIRRFRKIVESLDFETVFYEEKPPLRSLSILRFSPLFVKEFLVSNAVYVLQKRNAI